MTTINFKENYPYEFEGPMCRCDNCGAIIEFDQVEAVRDVVQRLTPGEEVPAGECPSCYALAYIIKPEPVPENPIKEDFTENNDRRRTGAQHGMEARPVGQRVRYLAARAKLIDRIVAARIDETEEHEMEDLATGLLGQTFKNDSDASLLEEAEFLEIKLDPVMLEALK